MDFLEGTLQNKQVKEPCNLPDIYCRNPSILPASVPCHFSPQEKLFYTHSNVQLMKTIEIYKLFIDVDSINHKFNGIEFYKAAIPFSSYVLDSVKFG